MWKCLWNGRFANGMLVCLIAVLIVAGASVATAWADERGELKKVAAGYRANMAKFRQFSCRFRTFASTISPDKEVPEANWREGRWIVNGNESLYEQYCSAAESEKTRKILEDPPVGREEVVVPCAPHAFILNDKLLGSYASEIGAFNLVVRAKAEQSGWSISPFSMDVGTACEEPSLNTNITGFLDGKRYAAMQPNQRVDGRELLVIETGRDKETISRRYFVDPTRGHLPIVIEVLGMKSEVISRFQVVRVREFSGGWFPISALSISDPDVAMKPHIHRRLEVTELTTDVPALSITLAPNTQVNLPGTEFFFVTRDELEVNAKDLGKVYARATERAKGGAN